MYKMMDLRVLQCESKHHLHLFAFKSCKNTSIQKYNIIDCIYL